MWEMCERYHQVCYVAPEVRSAGTEAGLKGFWMNYFATRAAPMGPVGPEVVEAVFFYYGPKRVHRAIPDAWRFSSPEIILAARYRAMDEALTRELGPLLDGPEIGEAVQLQRRSLEGAELLGRPLFAGWRSLEEPREPHLALWHLTTLQREYRSGCHLIALAAAGLDGCQSVVSQVAVDEAPQAWIIDEAGWEEADVVRARTALISRGWLDSNGTVTEAGRAGRRAVEEMTDQLDGRRWELLGRDRCGRLHALMSGLVRTFPLDDQLDWRQIYGDNR